MATLTKKNEAVSLPFFKNGVTLQFFTLEFNNTITNLVSATSTGTPSPVYKAFEAIQQQTSIEVMGVATTGTANPQPGTAIRVGIAALGGAYPTDDYDNTNQESMAKNLQDLIQAVTYNGSSTIQGVNMANTTVTNFSL
jgi:hypothetical protein